MVAAEQDHIQEIIDKWTAIDDEIWAKIICLERNRRIAKAYARKHALTVNGSKDEYLDGTTLGLNSFDNPDRDAKTRRIKQYIGQGLRIKITQSGDILVKRLSKANIFVHPLDSQSQYSDRSKSSSSDLYALNSEPGELYGIIGPIERSLANSNPSAPTNYPFRGSSAGEAQQLQVKSKRQQQKQQQQSAQDDHKLSATSSSDASTASSGGGGVTSSSFSHDKHHLAELNKLKASEGKLSNSTGSSNNNRFDSSMNSYASGSMLLDYNRPVKIFDMSKFKSILERESRLPCPNRKLLQSQCISVISFVVDDHKMLNLPSWIMIINIVAIDLLKIELGLVDPHDLLGSPSFDPLMDRHRLNQHQHLHLHHQQAAGNDYLLRHNAERMAFAHSRTSGKTASSGAREQPAHDNHLAASKKAFANAAALGAYNGDHHHYQSGASSSEGHLRGAASSQEEVSANGAGGRLKRYLAAAAGGGGKLNGSGAVSKKQQQQQQKGVDSTEITHQQSSSSSGFNSHCSSQNDSSAASSSSNIASAVNDDATQVAAASGSGKAADREVSSEPALDDDTSEVFPLCCDKKQAQTSGAVKPLPYKQKVVGNSESPGELLLSSGPQQHLSRGKRPPKLPHRVGPNSAAAARHLPDPLPIPVPIPASGPGAGGAKANLILVSPTGLSPPLPKRKGVAGRVSKETVPEFSTIKHIDENGRCSIIRNEPATVGSATKGHMSMLPAGIPAHAQLAPPATQRHILRYLMSATRGGQQMTNELEQQQQHMIRKQQLHYQRPLPILPGQSAAAARYGPASRNQLQQQHEESLYYCGLQARVPAARRPLLNHQLPIHHHNKAEKSAINLILSDSNLNSSSSSNSNIHLHNHHQHSCYNHQFLRHQFSLGNLRNEANFLHSQTPRCESTTCTVVSSNSASQPHQQQKQQQQSSSGHSAANPVTKPLMKLFKPMSAAKSGYNTGGDNLTGADSKLKGQMFLSVDNLHQVHQQQKSSPSLFSQMRLKRSKGKKVVSRES